MKKQYLFALGLMMAGLTASAQENLILNPGVENWTNGKAENFLPHATQDYINHNITQGTAPNVHGGSFSIKNQSKVDDAQYVEYNNLINVVVGHSYTISYWYLDNDSKATTRTWSSWLNSNNQQLGESLQSAIRDQSYSSDSPQWVFKTHTGTVPEGAAKLRYQVRTYDQGEAGGYIYYDDFSLINNTTAGVNDHAIAAVKMFPNPLNSGILTVLTESDAPKTVAIYDLLGKEVVNATTDNNTVNVSNLTAGVYMVKISQEGKTATRKLVVQ
ncbi:T9SS type A sorting domain-containing protein [uncultured Flavobacterium sp.]|uniref:T9SS type A sorting domain-containing protein n=1 Tax=uncultured Flavobacterium sp. TaxID=165435 RepID=UPI0025CDAEC2|nr:T9SS type A sorting domain-containing protein [uncultured Flavobacterium sp.]